MKGNRFPLATDRVQVFCMLLISAFILLMVFPCGVYAELEWTGSRQITLVESPLDVVQSSDGQWTFILTPDSVLVYTASADKVTQTIPVGKKGFDRMSFSDAGKRLVLTSSSQKLARIIELEVVHAIDVSKLPFRGSRNAPVTIAVFSDYQ